MNHTTAKLIVFAMFLSAFNPLPAQSLYSISGEIKSPEGKIIPYIQVHLRQDDDAQEIHLPIDENGRFTLKVPEGRYRLNAEAPGYRTLAKEILHSQDRDLGG